MNDQDSPKKNKPRIRNEFSLLLKFVRFLKKKEYVKVKKIKNNGIIFEVIKIKISLYFLVLIKYFIPSKEFSVKIDEI